MTLNDKARQNNATGKSASIVMIPSTVSQNERSLDENCAERNFFDGELFLSYSGRQGHSQLQNSGSCLIKGQGGRSRCKVILTWVTSGGSIHVMPFSKFQA
jgi:hypothetical protein